MQERRHTQGDPSHRRSWGRESCEPQIPQTVHAKEGSALQRHSHDLRFIEGTACGERGDEVPGSLRLPAGQPARDEPGLAGPGAVRCSAGAIQGDPVLALRGVPKQCREALRRTRSQSLQRAVDPLEVAVGQPVGVPTRRVHGSHGLRQGSRLVWIPGVQDAFWRPHQDIGSAVAAEQQDRLVSGPKGRRPTRRPFHLEAIRGLSSQRLYERERNPALTDLQHVGPAQEVGAFQQALEGSSLWGSPMLSLCGFRCQQQE